MANSLTKIKTNAIDDDAVTLAKQAAGTDGQIITYDASGNPTAVGPGTDGQVLTSTGAGSPPAFEALPTQISLANDANNRVITGTGSGLNGEANLTYDGTTLKNQVAAENGTIAHFALSGNTHNPAFLIKADESDQKITLRAGADASTYPSVAFNMGAVGDSVVIQTNGNLTISDGDLVIGTSGHGIDFSATSDASGAGSELLDDYEEGTWTPGVGTTSGTNVTGVYTKIGRLVHIRAFVGWSSHSNTGSNAVIITGLPFTPGHTGYGYLGDSRNINLDSNMNGIALFFNSDGVNFRENGDSTAADHLVWSQLGTDTYFGFSGTYFV